MALTPAVVIDEVQGASGVHHVIQGWTITRMATVTGVNDESGNYTTGQMLQDAINAVIQITGDRGAPCPGFDPIPTYLEQFVPEIISDQEVRIRIVYKGFPVPRLEFSSSLNQVENNKDAQGNIIKLFYSYPDNYLGSSKFLYNDPLTGLSRGVASQGGMITHPLPQVSYTIKFTVFAGLNDVTDLCLLEGSSNADDYPVGTIPGAPGTWLVTSVTASSNTSGVSGSAAFGSFQQPTGPPVDAYDIAFTIEYREITWDTFLVFINPDDGKPPFDIVSSGQEATASGTFTTPTRVSFPTFSFLFNTGN